MTPARSRVPQLLWSPDTLAVTQPLDCRTPVAGVHARYALRRLAFALFLVFAVSSASLRARAARARRLRRPNRSASTRSRETIEQARARLRPRQVDRRPVRRLARGARCGSISAARCCTTGRSRELIPERAANTAHPRRHRARCSRRSSACRSASSPAAGAAASLSTRDPRGVARAAVDAAAADVALSRLRRGAHRLVSDRRHAIGRRAAPVALLDLLHHLVVPAAALALPLAAMLERLQAQAMSEVVGAAVRARHARARRAALARRLARRAEGGAPAGRVGLRPRRRHAAQRIVRRRGDHGVARARPA